MSVSRLSRQSIQAGFPKQQSVWDGISTAAAMDPLGSIVITPSMSVSSVTFSSIPQTYTHLQIRLLTLDSRGSAQSNAQLYINGDNATNYTWRWQMGNGSTTSYAASTSSSNPYLTFGLGSGTTTYSPAIVDVLDYTNVNKYKVVRSFNGYENNDNASWVGLITAGWFKAGTGANVSDAITSLTINTGYGPFKTNCTFSLYGIK